MTCIPFVLTRKIESIISMSKLYNCLPSVLLGIDDDYTAFCFNEACAEIRIRLSQGEKPVYRTNKSKVKEYRSFKDFYKQYN